MPIAYTLKVISGKTPICWEIIKYEKVPLFFQNHTANRIPVFDYDGMFTGAVHTTNG